MAFEIQILKPCGENWIGMTSEAQGRFCGHCQKSVIDFTDWESEEISLYFQLNAGQKICGRFKENQLQSRQYSTNDYVAAIQKSPFSFLRKVAAIILVAFAGILASCTNPEIKNDAPVIGDTTIQENSPTPLAPKSPATDTGKKDMIRMGEPAWVDTALMNQTPKPNR